MHIFRELSLYPLSGQLIVVRSQQAKPCVKLEGKIPMHNCIYIPKYTAGTEVPQTPFW
jgi:hypothetical protein